MALGARSTASRYSAKRLPGPVDAGGQGGRRDVLGPLEVADDQLAAVGMGRGQREAAVAHHHGRDAVPARGGAERIPEHLGVHVGVAVDEAGRDDVALGVDLLATLVLDAADAGDSPVANPDVGSVRGESRTVDHRPVADHHVETHVVVPFRHGPLTAGLGSSVEEESPLGRGLDAGEQVAATARVLRSCRTRWRVVMIRRAFTSLRIRNFRLFMAGQLVSNIGTWCQAVALGWLVYTLTGSGTALGTVTAVQFVPALFFSMWGGLLADRFDKRKLLLVTQTTLAGMAAVLAGLVLTHTIVEWEVYVLAFLHRFGDRHRHAHPRLVRDRDGRNRRSGQRGGPQFGDGEPQPGRRTGLRRRVHQMGRVGVVLRLQRGILRGGHRRPGGHAAP